MTRGFLLIAILSTTIFSFSNAAENAAKESSHKEEKEHAHSETDHDHEEGEEEGANVGPDKGIIEASERSGFKLSPEALKNFNLKLKKLSGDGPWSIPRSALVHSGEEVNLFRLRSGFFKRIDFETIRKSDGELNVDSDDLREGDEIVLAGLGFLRVAELAAFGGVAHGHSH